MINNNTKETIGSLKISQDVIASIASVAASEVDGVSSINNISKSVFNLKKNLSPNNVKVNISNDLATVDVFINVKFDAKIQLVAQLIQRKVKEAIQSMTGIAISKVNVHVVGIDFYNDSQSQPSINNLNDDDEVN